MDVPKNYDVGMCCEEMKDRGVKGYAGMCCEEFYVKRQKAFADAGIPGVLMDIEGKTCYDLRQEKDAYSGTFEALADLKPQLVESVMKFVPQAEFTERSSRKRYKEEKAERTQFDKQ